MSEQRTNNKLWSPDMTKPTIKNLKKELEKWKDSALNISIEKGLIEIRAEKLQEKLEYAEGSIQDLQIENNYLIDRVIELEDILFGYENGDDLNDEEDFK